MKTKAKLSEAWRTCSVKDCHCKGSDHLHVETPYGTMYGPRQVMEQLLELLPALIHIRTLMGEFDADAGPKGPILAELEAMISKMTGTQGS